MFIGPREVQGNLSPALGYVSWFMWCMWWCTYKLGFRRVSFYRMKAWSGIQLTEDVVVESYSNLHTRDECSVFAFCFSDSFNLSCERKRTPHIFKHLCLRPPQQWKAKRRTLTAFATFTY